MINWFETLNKETGNQRVAKYTHPELQWKSSICTKCSLFDQQSLVITELAGLMRDFSSRATKNAKSLILPSVGYQRKENIWATPNNTGATVLQDSPEV